MRLSAIYMLVQAAAGVVWWTSIALVPASRVYFMPPDTPDWALLSFWLADLTCFVLGSLLCGMLLWRGSRHARSAMWFTSGAVSYAALYCVGVSMLTGAAWLATAAMTPAACATLWIAVRQQRVSS